MSTVDMAVERLKCEKTSHVDEQPKKKCAPEVAVMDAAPDGCFDCNICLDFVADPVVTICGHLFCWPCIYRWLQPSERSGARQPAERSCPVCKSTLSQDTLVPLYGRGHSGKGDNQDLQIPRRPVSAHRPSTEQHSPSNQHPPMQHPRENYYYPYFNTAAAGYTPSSSPLLGQTRVVHSVAGERPGGHGVGRDAVGVQEPGLDGRLQLEPVSRGELRGEQQEAQEAQEAGDGDGESAATNLALHTLLRHPVPPLVLRGTNILVRDCTYQIHRNRSHLPLSSAFCKGMR